MQAGKRYRPVFLHIRVCRTHCVKMKGDLYAESGAETIIRKYDFRGIFPEKKL